MPLTEYKQDLQRLRFPNDIEAAFQRSYFQAHRTHVTVSLWVIESLMFCLLISTLLGANYGLALVVAVPLFAGGVLLATLHRCGFVSSWQPLNLGFLLLNLSVYLFVFYAQNIYGVDRSHSRMIEDSQRFTLLLPFFAIGARLFLGLQRRWVVPIFLVVATILLSWNIIVDPPTAILARPTQIINNAAASPPAVNAVPQQDISYPMVSLLIAGRLLLLLIPTIIIFPVEWVWAGRNERKQRSEFLKIFLLERDRDKERDKREQTEAMLQVLSQAIGGIVHDLGNPLTSVQSGAETLQYFIEEGQADPETVAEFSPNYPVWRSDAQLPAPFSDGTNPRFGGPPDSN